VTLEDVEDAYRKIRYQTLLVAEARAAEGREGDPELTYGTTTPRLASQILDLAGAGPDDIFYDLGCGFGVPTIVAALRCKRATGIDVLPPLIARARDVAEELKLGNATFTVGDLRQADLSDGTVFYSYCTCLSGETRRAMADAIARARPGARIVTVTHALDHPRIELVEKTSLRWGAVSHSVLLQRLVKSREPASQ
jgi:SAM-dependent methyltransferase